MKPLPISVARKQMSELIEKVKTGKAIVIGRHNVPEVILIKYPTTFIAKRGEITNINAYSASFDFLKGEGEIYFKDDAK